MAIREEAEADEAMSERRQIGLLPTVVENYLADGKRVLRMFVQKTEDGRTLLDVEWVDLDPAEMD